MVRRWVINSPAIIGLQKMRKVQTNERRTFPLKNGNRHDLFSLGSWHVTTPDLERQNRATSINHLALLVFAYVCYLHRRLQLAPTFDCTGLSTAHFGGGVLNKTSISFLIFPREPGSFIVQWSWNKRIGCCNGIFTTIAQPETKIFFLRMTKAFVSVQY